MKNGWLVVVASLISGLLAVLISITVGACLDQREIKRDVLRRLAGHRYLLTDGRCPSLWVANYYSARNPLRLSSLVILGVVARMFRCATRSSCWCT